MEQIRTMTKDELVARALELEAELDKWRPADWSKIYVSLDTAELEKIYAMLDKMHELENE